MSFNRKCRCLISLIFQPPSSPRSLTPWSLHHSSLLSFLPFQPSSSSLPLHLIVFVSLTPVPSFTSLPPDHVALPSWSGKLREIESQRERGPADWINYWESGDECGSSRDSVEHSCSCCCCCCFSHCLYLLWSFTTVITKLHTATEKRQTDSQTCPHSPQVDVISRSFHPWPPSCRKFNSLLTCWWGGVETHCWCCSRLALEPTGSFFCRWSHVTPVQQEANCLDCWVLECSRGR